MKRDRSFFFDFNALFSFFSPPTTSSATHLAFSSMARCAHEKARSSSTRGGDRRSSQKRAEIDVVAVLKDLKILDTKKPQNPKTPKK